MEIYSLSSLKKGAKQRSRNRFVAFIALLSILSLLFAFVSARVAGTAAIVGAIGVACAAGQYLQGISPCMGTVATLAVPIAPLGLTDQMLAGGATHLIVVKYSDLATYTATASTPTATIELLAVEDGDFVRCIASRLRTAFADASDAAFNSTLVELGDGGDVDRLLVSQEVNSNGTEILAKQGVAAGFTFTGADTLDVKFTSTAGKALSDLDSGEIHFFVQIAKLGKLSLAQTPA